LAYCEDIAISTKHFTFSKLPVFSTKVTERFKISPDPIGKAARPLPIRRRPLSYGLPIGAVAEPPPIAAFLERGWGSGEHV
jgi:hypothetical protein